MRSFNNNQDIPPLTSKAERTLWDISTPDGADRQFRRDIFEQLPDSLGLTLAKLYRTTYINQGLRAANSELRELNDGLQEGLSHAVLCLAENDEDLRHHAKLKAEQCHRLRISKPPALAYNSLSHYVINHGLVPPVPDDKKISVTGAVARMCDELWWRRALRTTIARHVEGRAIKLGLVHNHAGIYASNETVTRHRQQRKRNRELLENHFATNELGDEYTLQELVDLTVSNPKIRRGELMTRIAGFEDVAKALGHKAEFYTLTCPSRMHARYKKSGQQVPNYDGTSPKEANAYLGKVWSRIRSMLDRQGIKPYGFRVCEPMHDATPHMHFLLFIDPVHTLKVRQIFEHYALQEDGDELGAREHRFNIVDIDPKKGTAAGYIAKYIAKNIDGFGMDTDLYGNDAASSAERVLAWSSTWGIRQFQQIGGPPVGLWRELRRMEEQASGIIEDARKAADVGDYAGFVGIMGGPLLARKEMPIKLAMAPCDKLTRYGEQAGDQIVGVRAGNITALSPRHDWVIRKGLAPGQPQGQEGLERNCTQDQGAGTGPAPSYLGSGTVPESSGPVLGSSGPGSGPVPVRFCSGSAPVPVRSGPVTELSGPNPGTIPGNPGIIPESSGTLPVNNPAYAWERTQREPCPQQASGITTEILEKKLTDQKANLEFCQ